VCPDAGADAHGVFYSQKYASVISGSDLRRRYRRLHLKPGEINGNTPVQTLKISNCPRLNITKSTIAKADSILQVSGFKFERLNV
jgi:hypothetical protein